MLTWLDIYVYIYIYPFNLCSPVISGQEIKIVFFMCEFKVFLFCGICAAVLEKAAFCETNSRRSTGGI